MLLQITFVFVMFVTQYTWPELCVDVYFPFVSLHESIGFEYFAANVAWCIHWIFFFVHYFDVWFQEMASFECDFTKFTFINCFAMLTIHVKVFSQFAKKWSFTEITIIFYAFKVFVVHAVRITANRKLINSTNWTRVALRDGVGAKCSETIWTPITQLLLRFLQNHKIQMRICKIFKSVWKNLPQKLELFGVIFKRCHL